MLTDSAIRKAKLGLKPYRMTDGRDQHLTLTPAGGKLWRWKYRHESSEKLMSFGQCPEVSLVQARERHAEARKILAGGIDPMAKRKAKKAASMASAANSLHTVGDLWLEHWKIDKRAQHVITTRRRLWANVFPYPVPGR